VEGHGLVPAAARGFEEAAEAFRKALLLRLGFPLAGNNLDRAQRQLDLKKSERERQQAPGGE